MSDEDPQKEMLDQLGHPWHQDAAFTAWQAQSRKDEALLRGRAQRCTGCDREIGTTTSVRYIDGEMRSRTVLNVRVYIGDQDRWPFCSQYCIPMCPHPEFDIGPDQIPFCVACGRDKED